MHIESRCRNLRMKQNRCLLDTSQRHSSSKRLPKHLSMFQKRKFPSRQSTQPWRNSCPEDTLPQLKAPLSRSMIPQHSSCTSSALWWTDMCPSDNSCTRPPTQTRRCPPHNLSTLAPRPPNTFQRRIFDIPTIQSQRSCPGCSSCRRMLQAGRRKSQLRSSSSLARHCRSKCRACCM